jgi:hypothetical protein
MVELTRRLQKICIMVFPITIANTWIINNKRKGNQSIMVADP